MTKLPDFEVIYNAYFKDVYRYALLLCRNETIAEEVTQETFFKALKNIDKFKGNCKLYVWLCQIAKNTYFTYCKKEKHRECGVDLAAVPEEDFQEKLLMRESANEVLKALHKLEEPYREVFMLRHFGELSFAQIGDLFAKTENWARVTFHRAKLKIREEFI